MSAKVAGTMPASYSKWKIFRNSILLFIATLSLLSCPFATPPAEGLNDSFPLTSGYGTTYKIQTWIPPNASTEMDTLSVLDGDEAHNSTSTLANTLIKDSIIPDILVVSIGYGDGTNERTRDYTPTISDGEGGGAASFFDFLADRLIPEIEARYDVKKTRKSRIFAGHSFGGLAVMEALFTRPELFFAYASSSPSTWWDENILFGHLDQFIANPPLLESRRFLSIGSPEGCGMNALFSAFTDGIKAAVLPLLSRESMVIPGKRHWDVRVHALTKALVFFYRSPL